MNGEYNSVVEAIPRSCCVTTTDEPNLHCSITNSPELEISSMQIDWISGVTSKDKEELVTLSVGPDQDQLWKL